MKHPLVPIRSLLLRTDESADWLVLYTEQVGIISNSWPFNNPMKFKQSRELKRVRMSAVEEDGKALAVARR